jgi:ATP-dependent Clp protease ATP-binding subunit ClpA
MTSNVGAAQAARTAKKTINLSGQSGIIEQAKAAVNMSALQTTFSPEFRNKLSAIISFNGLGEDQIRLVTNKFLTEAKNKLRDKKGIIVEFTQAIYEFISKEGFSSEFGARPIARMVNTKIVDVLVKPILRAEIKSGDSIQFDVLDNDIVYSLKEMVEL